MKVILNTVINLPLDHYPYRHDSMVPNTVTQFYGTDSQQLLERNLKYRIIKLLIKQLTKIN
jgi:hypothetical protein